MIMKEMSYVHYIYHNTFENVVTQQYMCIFANALNKKKIAVSLL